MISPHSEREYSVDLTSRGFMYAGGNKEEGPVKKYLHAALYDHVVSMTLPYIGKYKVGYNDGENPETVAENAIVKLGISPRSEVGAELVPAITRAILSGIATVSSAASSSNSPVSLPKEFRKITQNPFKNVFCSTGTKEEVGDNDPLSSRILSIIIINYYYFFIYFILFIDIIAITHLRNFGIDPPKPFMLKKHCSGHSSKESKGLCPDCGFKHFVNDGIYEFMVSFSTYKGIINIGWNPDENESDEACLMNVEREFRKAGVVHVPIEVIKKEVVEKSRAMTAQIKESSGSEYYAELKRLRAEKETRVAAEKRKVAEISQNIASINEEARAREVSRDRINKAIEMDKLNRQANREGTVSKGAILHGSGIGSNVSSITDLLGNAKDTNKVVARDGTVELKPPSSKYGKTSNPSIRGGGDYSSVLDEENLSDPEYLKSVIDIARRDPSLLAKIKEKASENPLYAMLLMGIIAEHFKGDNMIERQKPSHSPRRNPGHVLDDDDDGNNNGSSGNVTSVAGSGDKVVGTPPHVSPVDSQPLSLPGSSVAVGEPCGVEFVNDSNVPCVVARVAYKGKRETVSINKTATMKQLYLHVAWIYKGALPPDFKLVFSKNPRNCAYEKGVIPRASEDSVEIINKNLINII